MAQTVYERVRNHIGQENEYPVDGWRKIPITLIEGFERCRLIATVNDLNNQPRPTATFLRCLHLD